MTRTISSRWFLAWPLLVAMTASPLALLAWPAAARSLNTRVPRIHRSARTTGTVVPVEELHHAELVAPAEDPGSGSDRTELFTICAEAAPLPKLESSGVAQSDCPQHFFAEFSVFRERGPPCWAV